MVATLAIMTANTWPTDNTKSSVDTNAIEGHVWNANMNTCCLVVRMAIGVSRQEELANSIILKTGRFDSKPAQVTKPACNNQCTPKINPDAMMLIPRKYKKLKFIDADSNLLGACCRFTAFRIAAATPTPMYMPSV